MNFCLRSALTPATVEVVDKSGNVQKDILLIRNYPRL